MLPKYPIKAQNATNTESTDVAVFIVPDGAISGNEVDISAGGSDQTPWESDIDGAGYNLTGVGEIAANNFVGGYQAIATAAGTTTLTVDSPQETCFTGTTTQNCVLPVTSTLTLGQAFAVLNNSTGVVTVKASGGNTVKALAAGASAIFTCIAITGTTETSWFVSQIPGGAFQVDSSGNLAITNAGYNVKMTLSDLNGVQFKADPASGYIAIGHLVALEWINTGTSANEVCFKRKAANILGFYSDLNAENGAAFTMKEMTAPAAPAANEGTLFLQDNGAGKTQLMVIFSSGVAQQIAIQP